MNKNTFDRLSQNPHYKMSDKQKEEAAAETRQPMAAFGDFETHPTDLNRHPTEPVRINAGSKKSSRKSGKKWKNKNFT